MIKELCENFSEIYLATGYTDFRKQIFSLCNIIANELGCDTYNEKAVFIFCNKKRDSIKVLCYDINGFILLQKKLLNIDKMKFKWPKDQKQVKNITIKQLNWLLEGLEIEHKKSFLEVEISGKKIC